jgi:glycosyltransferase involved in cell wall biosynthesis
MPRVSIVIPAYNAAAYLNQTLDSVLRQTFDDWEVILVDDGSTDATPELIALRQADFGDRLKCLRQTNRGLPAARNAALRNSAAEFIALLDADDIWLENRLQRSVEALDHYPAAGLVHGPVYRIDAQGKVFENPWRPPLKYLSGNIARQIYTRRAHILCPTVTFRRKCLERAGMFDETLRATEDRDLWFRIAKHYPIVYLDEVLAHYRITHTAMSRDQHRMRTAQLQFLAKYRRPCGRMAECEARALMSRERADALFKDARLLEALSCYVAALVRYPLDIENFYAVCRAAAEPLLALLHLGTRSQAAGK